MYTDVDEIVVRVAGVVQPVKLYQQRTSRCHVDAVKVVVLVTVDRQHTPVVSVRVLYSAISLIVATIFTKLQI